MVKITGFSTRDIRFPTSLDMAGSDAMNPAADYSAAYCIIHTDSTYVGHEDEGTNNNPVSKTFTLGRGTEVVCAAISSLAPMVVGKELDTLSANWGKTWRYLNSDSQLRWIGPEKGVIHMALGALVNALWDLWAKTLHKPVWQVVSEMTPEEFVRCIDFRYIDDVLTPAEAIQLLRELEPSKDRRLHAVLNNQAVPAYTTSAGWLGYTEEKLRSLLQECTELGYKHFKLKVGRNLQEDKRRLEIAREIIGYDKGNTLMLDANQVWSVQEAISWMQELAPYKPLFIEEPTSPDDILGHAQVKEALKSLPGHRIGVATGEMVQNRIVFKQLLQQGALTYLQPDACRVGGLNEVLAILLLARKFDIPVVPHSGGVGLPEYTQHISTIDFLCVSGNQSILEYVDHLHEHFLHPARVHDGYHVTPLAPGYSVEMRPDSMEGFEFPGVERKSWWRSDEAKQLLHSRMTYEGP
ncbi:mandelate racemase/muconate lactonizing enzyme [Talaromyces pinophilus]|uniref:Mandelate racemase/muconate lactonizing enzyme n=1 Tax=Talaromyces pinophilus TaxID=128442 RepID=A0A0B8MY95_TALPI|nr:mandelate racemase/muconate lactonizing enzyme [Talaromyces pinophilus]